MARAKPGGRNNALNKVAFSLGGLVALGLLSREAVEDALLEAALAAVVAIDRSEAFLGPILPGHFPLTECE